MNWIDYKYPDCDIETWPTHQLATSRKSWEQFIQNLSDTQCVKGIDTPQEIANMVVFLASDLCPFITGANPCVDGSYTTI